VASKKREAKEEEEERCYNIHVIVTARVCNELKKFKLLEICSIFHDEHLNANK